MVQIRGLLVFGFVCAGTLLAATAKKKPAPSPEEAEAPLLDLPTKTREDSIGRANEALAPLALMPAIKSSKRPSPPPANIPANAALLPCEEKLVEKIQILSRRYFELVGTWQKKELLEREKIEKELLSYINTHDPASCFQGDADLEQLCLQMQNPSLEIDILNPDLGGTRPELSFERSADRTRNVWKIFYQGNPVGFILDDNHDGFLDSIILQKDQANIGGFTPSDVYASFLRSDLAKGVDLDTAAEKCLGVGLNPVKFYEKIVVLSDDLVSNDTKTTNGPNIPLRIVLWNSYFNSGN